MRPLLSQAEVEALLCGLHSDQPECAHKPLTLTIEFSQECLRLQDFTQLTPGLEIKLSVRGEACCEVWVNHQLVAYGEVITVDDHVSIRITRLLDTEDR